MRELTVVQIVRQLDNFIQVTDDMKRKISQIYKSRTTDRQNSKKCKMAISRRQFRSRHATKIQTFWRCYRYLKPINNLEERNPKDPKKKVLYHKGKIVCCPITLEAIPVHDLFRVRFFSPGGMQVVAYTKSELKKYFEMTDNNAKEFTCPLTTKKIGSDLVKSMGIQVSLESLKQSYKEAQAAVVIACLDATLQDLLTRFYEKPDDPVSTHYVNDFLIPQWDNDIDQLSRIDPQFTIDKFHSLYTTLTRRLNCNNTNPLISRYLRVFRMKILGEYQVLFYQVNMTYPDPPNTVSENDKFEQNSVPECPMDTIIG